MCVGGWGDVIALHNRDELNWLVYIGKQIYYDISLCMRLYVATVFGVIQLSTSADKHRCTNITLTRRVTNITHFYVQMHLRCAKLNSATQNKTSIGSCLHTLGVDCHHVPTSSVVFTPTLLKKVALKYFLDCFVTPFRSCSPSSMAQLHAHSHISVLTSKIINNGFKHTAKINHFTYSRVDDRHT